MYTSSPISKEALKWLPIAVRSHPIYEIACRIFRVFAMVIQYAFVLTSIILRHWRFFPSALPYKFLKVYSRNIGSFYTIQKCLQTAWNPLSKSLYRSEGCAQGLRITHDITYHPASGLCLGMSLTFLAESLVHKKELIASAKVLQSGGTEICIKTQALYYALMGLQGKASQKDINKLLQGEDIRSPLCSTVKAFFEHETDDGSLRKFVFEELEKKHIEITPDDYTLVLELEAAWRHKKNPKQKKYDFIHDLITQTVVSSRQLEIANISRIKGKITLAAKQLNNLENGHYLIQFSDHTIALIKNREGMALFDPREGMAQVPPKEQTESLHQLLDYYGNNGSVSIKVIQLHESLKQTDQS